MLALGLNVPGGFVITNTAFRLFCDANEIGCNPSSPPDLSRIQIPHEILNEVLDFWPVSIPAEPVVVRSSAVGEDGVEASFAGQLDSILHVETIEDIKHALLTCWCSYWNERVLSYQRAKGVRLRGMAVIVQTEVKSLVSGVLFTRAPETRVPQAEICVEYCAGFADALVTGRLNPGRFRVDRGNCRYTIDERQHLDTVAERLLFNARQIEALAHTADVLEAHFGRPQDVEWTIDDSGKLFLLQSRPITATAFAGASGFASEVLWSNANVNENFPGPITPFLYSIAREGYYHYFRNLAIAFGLSRRRIRAMEHSLRYLVGVHHARIYYNLTAIHSVLRTAPFGDELAGFFNDFVGADAIAPAANVRQSSRWAEAFELCKTAIRTTQQVAFLTRRVEQFERTADEWAESTHPSNLENRSLLALRDSLRGFMEIRCHRWTNASLADAASMFCYGILRLLLRRAFPSESDSALHNNLLKGLGGVVSVQPAIELWELSRRILAHPETAQWFAETKSSDILKSLEAEPRLQWLLSALNAYLERWGFRFSGELMLTLPSFQEDPTPLFDMLKTYLKAEGAAPIDAIRQIESAQISAATSVLADLRQAKRIRGIPRCLQAPIVSFALKATRRSIQLRERARSKQALLYSRCRRIALAIGSQLVRNGTLYTAADVFFLSYPELDELLSGCAMFPETVAETIAIRKRAHFEASKSVAPETFNMREGDYRASETIRPNGETSASGKQMFGNAACGGHVTARAAVLESVADAHLLEGGDILVTRQTDPGWAPVFSLIRGLVIERGGMLSHGAIIAREFGLPCVVGVKEATTRIPQRSLVFIDGDRGHVRILD